MTAIVTKSGLELHTSGAFAMLRRISAVVGNTLREAGRAKLFYGLLGAAVMLLGFSLVLSDLALVDQKARLVQSFGMAVVPLVCVGTAVLMGALLLHKEIDKKTLYAILPKPIARGEFIAGKLLGLCALLVIELVALALVWWAVLSMRGGQMTGPIVRGLALHVIELVLVTSIAVFFSALTRPVLSGLLTAGVFVVGRVTYVITDLLAARKGLFVEVPAMRAVGKALVVAIPDLSTFAVADPILQGWDVPWSYVASASMYGLCWALAFAVGAVLLFQRRDFT
jgi:ABC-type transport system involved in multi-copper enzyme maturation permease subunit